MERIEHWISLDVGQPIWDRFFTVAPLYVIGTRDEDGTPDLAPKHLATPVSWDNYFGFVCHDEHSTLKNIKSQGVFTVSSPRPDQVVLASLAASPRCQDGSKPIVEGLPTVEATEVSAPCLAQAYFHLECRLERLVEDLGRNTLVIGAIVAARVDPEMLVATDRDPQSQLKESPLLAYLPPTRFATVSSTQAFPFPKDFRR